MCRLFAISGGDKDVTAAFWLLGSQTSLVKQSKSQPDGAGIGWFDLAGEPIIKKQPLAAYNDQDFVHTAQLVKSPIIISHLRNASTGNRRFRNTHPFSQGGFIFAHNGVIEGQEVLMDYLNQSIFQPIGETDSEIFFCCLLKSIYQSKDTQTGIIDFLAWVQENIPIYAANFLLAGRNQLWALRWPEQNMLWYLDTQDSTSQFYHSSTGLEAVIDHNTKLVIATERLDDNPGWELLQSGELLTMQANGNFSRQIVVSSPKHRLSEENLSNKAASSQEQ